MVFPLGLLIVTSKIWTWSVNRWRVSINVWSIPHSLGRGRSSDRRYPVIGWNLLRRRLLSIISHDRANHWHRPRIKCTWSLLTLLAMPNIRHRMGAVGNPPTAHEPLYIDPIPARSFSARPSKWNPSVTLVLPTTASGCLIESIPIHQTPLVHRRLTHQGIRWSIEVFLRPRVPRSRCHSTLSMNVVRGQCAKKRSYSNAVAVCRNCPRVEKIMFDAFFVLFIFFCCLRVRLDNRWCVIQATFLFFSWPIELTTIKSFLSNLMLRCSSKPAADAFSSFCIDTHTHTHTQMYIHVHSRAISCGFLRHCLCCEFGTAASRQQFSLHLFSLVKETINMSSFLVMINKTRKNEEINELRPIRSILLRDFIDRHF